MPERFAALLLALLCALPARADEARWYKVELLVFSQRGGEFREQWEATPQLAYPAQYRFLVSANAGATLVPGMPREQSADAVVTIDDIGRRVITLPDPAGDADPAPVPAAATTGSAPDDGAGGADASAEDAPLRPTAFVQLPAAELEFRGKAAYMQRNGPYRILFHQAWAQPLLDKADTLPIVLDRSGDTQDWPPLQGSISLYLSRYLHLETNLWLNTDGRYLPGTWRMPAAPLGPASILFPQPTVPASDIPAGAEAAGEDAPLAPGIEPVQEQVALAPIYPYRHAVSLRQKRRMRSLEVHYLDHPMLGVVAKVTPLDEELLEGMALAEQARREKSL